MLSTPNIVLKPRLCLNFLKRWNFKSFKTMICPSAPRLTFPKSDGLRTLKQLLSLSDLYKRRYRLFKHSAPTSVKIQILGISPRPWSRCIWEANRTTYWRNWIEGKLFKARPFMCKISVESPLVLKLYLLKSSTILSKGMTLTATPLLIPKHCSTTV